MMTEPTIICPNCKTEIKLTESLAAPLIEATRKEFEKRLAQKDTDMAKRESALRDKEETLSKEKESIDNLVAEKLRLERSKIAGEMRIQNINCACSAYDEVNQETFLPGYMLLIDEPETALHPSAVRAAKEHLYPLSSEAGWQVMLSTHHPAFVDPLKDHTTIVRLYRTESHLPPNVYRSDEIVFSEDELQNLKSLLAFDVSVAEMFFGSHVIIVEGDTEFAAFSEIMNNDPTSFHLDVRPLIIRARGKATIPTLVKILTHFKINFAVLHDIDSPKTREGDKANPAYSMNTNISEAVNNSRQAGLKVIHQCSCPNFEQHHGMKLPKKDKPYESWRTVRENADIKASVRDVLNKLIGLEKGADGDNGQYFEAILRKWVLGNAPNKPAYSFD